ncbi:hypothetical protein SAMN04489724_3695 [Algoriphagus locisalis]|uniref:Tissue inhibitor of metalloproteinase n=1 Tax=Algoriphagus locisalis TaxID=305507 RepID=A0A1I7D6T7_9BACT|nr:hypothetical protein [Algoriphagus locisalis]SFU07387.1 hypothetical protein SAMN04489724_3695 [Algoriphagus locisalis]
MINKIQNTERHQYHCASILKKTVLILFILSLTTFGWACTCNTIAKKVAKKITKNADYVLLGTAVENVHHSDSIEAVWDSEKVGINVKFKVEKVYKGSLQTEFVYINQFETDNCTQSFRFGEKYIIVGTLIEKFENLRPFSEAIYKKDEIFETVVSPPPPPIGGLSIRKMKCYNIEMELVDYWNKIAENEIVVYTNQCSSFHAESTYGKYFSK